ncbi:hypothetical protein DR088_03315 [Mycoplasma hyopneumoniae]|nr:hypothetical protein [Mesomycoplasma hyopneumoniae]
MFIKLPIINCFFKSTKISFKNKVFLKFFCKKCIKKKKKKKDIGIKYLACIDSTIHFCILKKEKYVKK